MKPIFRLATTLFVLSLLSSTSYAVVWKGTESSDFQKPANWSNVPAVNATNSAELAISNGEDHALEYTANEGDTTFSTQLLIGGKNSSGELKISGGSLSVNGTWEGIIGQVAPGKLTISGGAFKYAGKDLWIGNEAEGKGLVSISGGKSTVAENLLLSRHNGSGILEISGGLVLIDGTAGVTFGTGSREVSKINFGLGAGEFRQTASDKITFLGADDSATAYINFVTGSKGKLSLINATSRDYFDGLVKQGRIKVDDKTVENPAKVFQFITDGPQGIYSLIADKN